MNDREYQCTIIFHRTANLIISIKKNITSRVSVRIWEKSEVRIRGEISKGISKQISKEGGRTLQNQLGSDVLFKQSPRQCLLFINLKYQKQNIVAAKYAESQNKTSNRQTHLALLIYQLWPVCLGLIWSNLILSYTVSTDLFCSQWKFCIVSKTDCKTCNDTIQQENWSWRGGAIEDTLIDLFTS